MAYRKLKLAALITACLLVGVAGGSLGTAWLFFHVYGNAGDFAAGRAVAISRLLIGRHELPASQAEVYQNVLQSMRENTVDAGLTFGAIDLPTYPPMLKHVLGRLAEYPGLYVDDGTPATGDASIDIYSAKTANAVRACIMQDDVMTRQQVGECAAEAVNRATHASATGTTSSPASTIRGAAPRTPEVASD
jgi:hypothetical protein